MLLELRVTMIGDGWLDRLIDGKWDGYWISIEIGKLNWQTFILVLLFLYKIQQWSKVLLCHLARRKYVSIEIFEWMGPDSVGLLVNACIHLWLFCFRLDNSTSWAVPCPQRRLLTQLFTECECLSVTPCWLVPNSGITWSANTRLERFKERSSPPLRSSKRRLVSSETTEFSWDIWPELVPSTCTRSTETAPSMVQFPKCTWRWLADTVLDRNPSRSLELAFFRTHRSNVTRLLSTLHLISDSLRLTSVCVPQLRPCQPEPELWDQPWFLELE